MTVFVRPPDPSMQPDPTLPVGVIDGHAEVMLARSLRLTDDAAIYRTTAINFARTAGMTYQAIGEHLRLSEARVRQILAGPEIAGRAVVQETGSNTVSSRINGDSPAVSGAELSVTPSPTKASGATT